MNNVQIAEACMRAFWKADLGAAYQHLDPQAEFWFARSLGYPRPSPAREALANIVRDMYDKFVPAGGFVPVLTKVLADGEDVWLNYTASGKVFSGADYNNEYIMKMVVRGGKVVRMQPFTDTLYLSKLFSGETVP
jgi:ketosteroid isomerase-like protein